MANIEITLGTVNIPDNTVESGDLTQQDMKDWLDEQFDKENAGSNYVARITSALRLIGIRGVGTRVSAHKRQKDSKALVNRKTGIITEAE